MEQRQRRSGRRYQRFTVFLIGYLLSRYGPEAVKGLG